MCSTSKPIEEWTLSAFHVPVGIAVATDISVSYLLGSDRSPLTKRKLAGKRTAVNLGRRRAVQLHEPVDETVQIPLVELSGRAGLDEVVEDVRVGRGGERDNGHVGKQHLDLTRRPDSVLVGEGPVHD